MTEETMDKKYPPLASLVDLPGLHRSLREQHKLVWDMMLVVGRLREAAKQKPVPAPPKTVTKWRVSGVSWDSVHSSLADAVAEIHDLARDCGSRKYSIERVEVPADD